MALPKPLVLPVEIRPADRRPTADFYLPDDVTRPRPAVVIVHGGPIPAAIPVRPRGWPSYQGYASLMAAGGAVGVMFDHRLHSPAAYPVAAGDVRATVEAVRADPRVDGDRVALWFFSGGGLLSGEWLREPPTWLRCVALTYPYVTPAPGWETGLPLLPADAVTHAGDLPIVLTRAGREDPGVAEGVAAFVEAAAKSRLHLIDVPHGRHGFDTIDDDDDSRAAIAAAAEAVLSTVKGD